MCDLSSVLSLSRPHITQQYIEVTMIKGYASEVLDLACQGFDIGGDRCAKHVLPDGGFDDDGSTLIMRRNVTDRHYSLIPSFVDIFTQH